MGVLATLIRTKPALFCYLGCISISMLLLVPSPLLASVQRLEPLLVDLLKNNKKIKGTKVDFAAEKDRLKMEKGKLFPVIDVTINRGFEQIDGEGTSSDSNLDFHEVDLSLTQTVWDFGATLSDIRKGEQGVDGKSLLMDQQMQESLVEGITAFLEVKRAAIVLDYAKLSEANIRRKTGLEEILIEGGAGLTSDLIEAKKQLAESQTKLFNSELAMVTQSNNFKKIFASTPVDVNSFEDIDFAILSHIPLTLHEAITRVENNNRDIKLALVDVESAQNESDALRSRSFFPKIEAVLEQKWKQNVGGTAGNKKETLGKLELTFPISLGMTELNEYRASIKDKDSLTITMESLRDDMVEEVGNAWQKLITSTMVWTSIRRQADLAAASLEISYSQSNLGMSSQIQVLTAETALLTAQSDASSARIDILINALSLLKIMGDVKIGILSKVDLKKGSIKEESLPYFHRDLSLEPSSRVVASLQKITDKALSKAKTATPEVVEESSDSDPLIDTQDPDSMLSEEERKMQEEYLVPDTEPISGGQKPVDDSPEQDGQAPTYEDFDSEYEKPPYEVPPDEIEPEEIGSIESLPPVYDLPDKEPLSDERASYGTPAGVRASYGMPADARASYGTPAGARASYDAPL
ncbi:MAG: TolC family protein [Magnetococcales bacterium]|nr:TolC family protein [Magnetococcales bacterium]